MRSFRPAMVAGLSAVLVLLWAAPAWAHEEINPKIIGTGTPTFFTLSAANEKTSDLTKVVLTAPSGTDFGEATRSPAGWTVNRTDTVITWTGGKVAPGAFEQWGFEIEGADQPGTLSFKVTLTAGGAGDDVTVPVTVVAGSGASAGADTSLNGKVSSARSRSNTALALGVIALVLALVALVLVSVRGRGPAGTARVAVPQDF